MNDKYTEIDGKFYQEAQVVMLPTKNASRLHRNGAGYFYYKDHPTLSLMTEAQHLYFLSDEEIKKGDCKLCLNDNFISQYQSNKSIESDTICKDCKKIIATTDSDLEIYKLFSNKVSADFSYLPRPSNSFIEKFVNEWNKGNKTDKLLVRIEMERYNVNVAVDGFRWKLTVAPDNTITIKPLVVKGKVYTTDQVEQLLNDYGKDMIIACQLKKEIPYYVDWLKQQNL